MQENFSSMSIEFSFEGTAVYVYFILANNVGPGITTESLADFILDGEVISTFHHNPTNSSAYEFNSLVFSKDGLANINHTLLIKTSGVDRHIYNNFDYATYTFDDTPTAPNSTTPSRSATSTPMVSQTTTAVSSPSQSSVPVGAIAGGVVGGVVILIGTIFILLFLRRRRHRVSTSGVPDESFSIDVDGFPPSANRQDTPLMTNFAESMPSRPGPRPQTLPPPYTDSTVSDTTGSESTGQRRQAEIDHRIRDLTREMQVLGGVDVSSKERGYRVQPSLSFYRSSRRQRDVARLQEEVNAMRGEIEYLQAQLNSDWARGLSNEPPPSYSVGVPSDWA
ncbi:hypothetical protein H0H87_003174 [Tephrocybe sp. NHM501043]|nr:hypothetical protein H0H87_003174 [Tephrocybe sp. NHM501043]